MSPPCLRIFHVIPSLDLKHGGPSVAVMNLATAQAALGHTVRIFSYAPRGEATAPNASVEVISVPTPSRLELLFARGAERALDAPIAASDVVHLHSIWTPIIRAASRVARRHNVPYLVAPHGMLDPWSLSQKRWKKQLAMFTGVRSMLDHANAIHALNVDEGQLLTPLNLKPPVEIIPNGVDLAEILPLPVRGTFRHTVAALADHRFVLFLSRLHPKKGLDYLADAFALVAARDPDLRLVVAGPEDGAGDDFRSRIARAGLADRVHVIGPLYGASKFAAFVDATCYCLPSRQEGFSVAILEALACGTPVVISDACHFPEVAQAHAGIIAPLDARAIAEAILKITNDAPIAATMGRAGAELVSSRFTWTQVAARSLDAYARASKL